MRLPVRSPRRIVSLVPSWTEALFVIGLGDRVVGVTDWCFHPADAVKDVDKVGGTKNAKTKKIIGLQPDLVIANHEENLKKHVERLEAAGIPVWVTYARTVNEGLEEFRELAQIEGVTIDAINEFVAPCEDALHRAAAQLKTSVKRPSVFCPIWKEPWMAVGSDTYCSDMLEVCGGRNCFASNKQGRYPKVSDEEIIEAAPEVILLPSEPFEFGEEHRQELLQMPIPAADTGRIHLIDGTLLSWYGPRVKEAIDTIQPILLPAI